MLHKFSLKQRIAGPLVAMVLGILSVSGVLITQYYQKLQAAKGMTRSVDTIQAVSNLIHEIQKERAASVLFLNKVFTKGELEAQRSLGNKELQDLEALAGQRPTPEVQVTIAAAIDRYQEIRRTVDEQKTPAADVARMIGGLVDLWINVQVQSAHAFPLEGLEANLLSISIFEKSKESMGRLRALLNVVLSADKQISSGTVSLLATHKAGVLANMESPGLSISESSRLDVARILKTEDWTSVLKTYDTVIEKADVGQFGYDSKTFSGTITRVIDEVRNVIRPEIDRAAADVRKAADEALRNFVLCTSIISLLTLISVLLGFQVTLSVNRSLDQIATLMLQGAEAVSKIASHIADASQKLASSATEQAAALQETSAAIEETSAMVRKNAENSRASADLSKQSHGSALKGQDIVAAMTLSMEDIAKSNADIVQQTALSNRELGDIVRVIQEIEGKTRVINDIVFQTKLLSFNASVEAARAGEQGKGFAVVAEEVGNLAQMSGSSAKEIREMLDGSLKLVETIVSNNSKRVENIVLSGKGKIEAGVETAGRCGAILQEIVDNVSRVGVMTNEISQACGEQSEGISEINRAMTELDGVAQQNSVACEQTSSSAEELKNQAARLQSMVLALNHVVHGGAVPVENPTQSIEQPAIEVDDDDWGHSDREAA